VTIIVHITHNGSPMTQCFGVWRERKSFNYAGSSK